MNLLVDIGNTRTKAGIFGGGRLLHQESRENGSLEFLLELATNQKVENVILSSVAAPAEGAWRAALATRYRLIELDAKTPLPIQNRYQTPETLGKDRLAAVVGAYGLFPGQHCLVIDAGTCITYDFLRKDGAYLGGNIAPGIRMRLRAMHTFTARLPEVAPGEIGDWIGSHTALALRNGGQLGAFLEAEGFIRYCQSRFGAIKVVFTGGDADFFAKKMKSEIFVNHNLVLLGLNQILEYNVKRLE